MICVALDIDGTLVNADGILHEQVKKILQLRWNDFSIILVSARPPQGIEYILRQLNRDNYYIAFNGGLIIPGINEHPIYTKRLTPKIIFQLLDDVSEVFPNEHFPKTIFVYTPDNWFAWGNEKIIEKEEKLTNYQAVIAQREDIYKIRNLIKVVIACENLTEWNEIYEYVSHRYNSYCKIEKSKTFYLEITNKKASKGEALEYLSRTLDFKRIISIGDGENDISMFQISDLSYATESSTKEVRDKATYILKEPLWTSLTVIIQDIGKGGQ